MAIIEDEGVLTPEEQKYYDSLKQRGYLALGAEIEQLKSRLSAAEDVLRQYADEDHWVNGCWMETKNGWDLAREYREKWGK